MYLYTTQSQQPRSVPFTSLTRHTCEHEAVTNDFPSAVNTSFKRVTLQLPARSDTHISGAQMSITIRHGLHVGGTGCVFSVRAAEPVYGRVKSNIYCKS